MLPSGSLRALLVLALVSICSAQDDHPFSVPPADAPELAAVGSFAIGVRTVEVKDPGQIDIVHWDAQAGKAPVYDRPFVLEVWYPAAASAGRKKDHASYELPVSAPPKGQGSGVPATARLAGIAVRNAAPLAGQAFPLVILSHGFPGSRYTLLYLAENLASKGYVVVAIDHTDSVVGRPLSFQSTLLNRSRDQLFTIRAVGEMAAQPGQFLHGLLDGAHIAIVGYSMGGYGALGSAGAKYSKQGMPARFVPGGYFDELTTGVPKGLEAESARVNAVVALAPWGEQPPYRCWNAEGLAGIHVPTLFIAGDHDDVADYAKGILPAFEGAVNSDRCMLVYENALHNVGGNPPPAEALGNFTTRESYDEPVWRKDRITAINEHFITAFLDGVLKGDASKRAFLHVLPEKSNDGVWPEKTGDVPGSFSTGVNYWKGFQRRWAIGMEMHCLAPGGAAHAGE